MIKTTRRRSQWARRAFRLAQAILLLCLTTLCPCANADDFFKTHCQDCHNNQEASGGLDLTNLPRDFAAPDQMGRWIKIHDRISDGEMPPHDAGQPTEIERAAILKELRQSLIAAQRAAEANLPRLRRLTRVEYENTIRDLFDMPGIALAGNLPADGSAHGFDKHPEALDISHVHIDKYLESADRILDNAIATRPQPPRIETRRISLANRGGFVAHVLMNGDGVLLKKGLPDPEFPPAGEQNHLDQGAHERMKSFRSGATVGLFRHEDESFNPYFIEHVTIYPARYRVRTSFWSFQWDRGKMLPGRGTESARLSVVQLTGDGRGGQHPSYVLGYFDAPNTGAVEHELYVWLNHNEIIGFNTASLAPVANYARPGRALAFSGPGIAVDWLDIEGPLYQSWPPHSHQVLFAQLPMQEFNQPLQPNVQPPSRPQVRQLGAGQNRPDPISGLWTVQSDDPIADAKQLLADFLPKLFRRPVSAAIQHQYLQLVRERLAAGDCFETAMRAAYRNALVAPDFLYHVEPQTGLDQYAIACRLSYMLWNSLPDEQLTRHAAAGTLLQPDVLHSEVERLLADARFDRFLDDFLGQWLRLREIAATDPDRKLYPEFSPYLQDAMVAETRAYVRELLNQDLDASHLVQSDFVMVNQKLATHYDIPGVSGSQIRRIPLPQGCPRGGLLTQASILKVTANGTTTSPVPRGAFVMDRILGQPPEPPPANVAAVEPDVRGTTTIREQLEKHREDAACASCHRRIDPPGFALESFDVIGGFRQRYRSIGEGDQPSRGSIDPFIGIGFKLGPAVDSSGELPDGRPFVGDQQYRSMIAADTKTLLTNLIRQLAVYATGRQVRFIDRPLVDEIVARSQARGGGIRTALHELIASPLFTGHGETIVMPSTVSVSKSDASTPQRMMMVATAEPVTDPVVAEPPDHDLPEPPSDDFAAAAQQEWQVRGLFDRRRVEEFQQLFADIPEAKLINVNFATARATIAIASESELFRGASTDQIVERLHNRIRQLSEYTIGVQLPPQARQDALTEIEIPIVGLDCRACSLAVYETLMNVDGVVRAQASFGNGRATAWIDGNTTDRSALEAALRQKGVQLSTSP